MFSVSLTSSCMILVKGTEHSHLIIGMHEFEYGGLFLSVFCVSGCVVLEEVVIAVMKGSLQTLLRVEKNPSYTFYG